MGTHVRSHRLACVVFDYLLLLEELRKIFSLGEGDDFASEVRHVGIHVGGNRGALEVVGTGHAAANLSVTYLNFVANLELEAWDVHDAAVHKDVAVIHHLPGLENRAGISESPDARSEAQFEQSQEIQAGVAAHSLSLLERIRELLLEHVVVAADDLFGQKLLTVLGLASILKVRPVLAGRVCAFGGRALRSSPDVVADGAANIGFSSSVGRH